MFQDLKFGLKLLGKEKAFSLAALLTLALCIGANTAIFTVLNSVVLEPLPFPEPDRLVTLYNIYPGVGVTDRGANGVPDYIDRRKMKDVFEDVALIGGTGYDVGIEGSPQRVRGEYVTPSYFPVLGIKAALGRVFTEEEAVLGKEKVAILGDGLWRQMFAADPGVLGRDIRLSGVPYRIIGVLPPGFDALGREVKIWVPFAFRPEQTSDKARHSNNWGMIARLRSGVSVAYAKQRIDILNKQTLDRMPEIKPLIENAKFQTKVIGLKDELVREIRPTLYLLQAAVFFVLLIGCVNLANLMLVRANVRIKELAIRFSLGAGRWRLGRQLLTESVTLAVIGGILGIGVGYAGVRLLLWLGANDLPRADAIAVDGTVLAFSAALAVITGLAFGTIPIVNLFHRNLNEVFRDTERTGSGGRRAVWVRSTLVVCQVSLAFVLLIGAGLLTLSFMRVLSVSPGFQPEGVYTAQISLPESRYKEDVDRQAFLARVLDRSRVVPGVAAAGLTTFLPFGGNSNASVIDIVGYTRQPGENPPVPGWNSIDSGYFKAMGIPLLSGRGISDADTRDAQKVVVIDEYLAKRHWPKGNAIGAQIYRGIAGFDDGTPPICTIVGVVGSVKTGDLADQKQLGQVYFSYKQYPQRNSHLVLKARGEDPQLISAVRRELAQLDPELPLYDNKLMTERLSTSVAPRRAAMILCLLFAGLAVLLSAIGIYGVLAYSVTQRTRELGIRVALGAEARDVLRMVVGQGLTLAGVGLVIGAAGAVLLTRLMATLLYDVKPSDPGVFSVVALVLAAVAVVASLIPSIRALRIRPAIALRYE